ncbi:MAG: 50S ribosomal protein L24 [Bacteroidota bacterium]
MHVKKGDEVRIIAGKERGKTGKVLQIVHKTDKRTGELISRAIVEGVALVTKHRKPDQQNPQGSIIETEGTIHVSNLQLLDPKSGEPTRIGRQKTENGWVRVSKKSGEIIK